MATDTPQVILDLLQNNWNNSNTDSKNPNFYKITEVSFKRYDFNKGTDVILIHRPRKIQKTAGIGVGSKHTVYMVDVDIRVFGRNNETHFLKVTEEVERILDANIVYLTSGLDIINPDTDGIDQSNKTHEIWRFIRPLEVTKYNQTR